MHSHLTRGKRKSLLAQDPHCYFCQKTITSEDSGLFRFSNKNPYNRENGIHIGKPAQVLACLDCIYRKRLQSSNGRSQKKREKLIQKDPHCYYCKCEVTLDNSTLDHLIPRSKGGRGNNNLVLCCYLCNHKKGDRTAEEYLAFLGFT